MAVSRTGRFSDYLVVPWLQQVQALTIYATLFTSDPFTVQNPATVEVINASYSRHLVSLTLSGRLLTSSNQLLFTGIPAGSSLVSIGAFDAAFNGNFLGAGPLPGSPVSYLSGGFLTVAAGSFFMGIDA